MSTKSTLFYNGVEHKASCSKHKLGIHAYKDLHQPGDTIVFEFYCSTCYCSYKFLMDEHLGKQLVELLK